MSNKETPSKSSPKPFDWGLVEIFTGDGKGKTSAALGVTLRALGHNLRVYIVYFMQLHLFLLAITAAGVNLIVVGVIRYFSREEITFLKELLRFSRSRSI